jgi:hypothetical protein
MQQSTDSATATINRFSYCNKQPIQILQQSTDSATATINKFSYCNNQQIQLFQQSQLKFYYSLQFEVLKAVTVKISLLESDILLSGEYVSEECAASIFRAE